jgi:hypothetical protein
VLAAGVDDEHHARDAIHLADPFQVALDLVHLTLQRGLHFLGVGFDLAGGEQFFELFEAVEAGANRAEVGQCPTQPAFGHVMHADALRFFFD